MIDHATVESSGVRLHVATAGDPANPTVVLIHGWPDSWRCWGGVIGHLVQRFHVVAYDQRGFGWSGMPKGTDAYGMERAVGDLAAVMDHVGVGRASVVGHDFGGAVVWNAGSFVPDLVERGVVVAAPHPLRLRQVAAEGPDQLRRAFYVWLLHAGEAGERLLAAQGFEPFARWVFAGSKIAPEIVAEHVATWSEPGRFTAMAEWYRAAYRPDLLNPDVPLDLPPVTVPIRYLHGEYDFGFAPEAATGSGAFVDAPYEESVVPGATHWLPYDAPAEVARVITDWLLPDG
ncbi:MAG: alpha/beta fold hydrolase [Acidimicrobiia bacterium]|nr:alpha/beta fold hydrolase [Acidimicrobiia bacterium]